LLNLSTIERKTRKKGKKEKEMKKYSFQGTHKKGNMLNDFVGLLAHKKCQTIDRKHVPFFLLLRDNDQQQSNYSKTSSGSEQ